MSREDANLGAFLSARPIGGYDNTLLSWHAYMGWRRSVKVTQHVFGLLLSNIPLGLPHSAWRHHFPFFCDYQQEEAPHKVKKKKAEVKLWYLHSKLFLRRMRQLSLSRITSPGIKKTVLTCENEALISSFVMLSELVSSHKCCDGTFSHSLILFMIGLNEVHISLVSKKANSGCFAWMQI